jgi:hypothetical protein
LNPAVVYAFLFIGTIIVLDLAYRALDPRVRAFGESLKPALDVNKYPA